MAIITSAERVGIKRGKIQGKIEGLHESIAEIFEIKFGRNIYELFAQLKQIKHIETLQKIRHDLIKAETLEETKNLMFAHLSN